MMDYTIKVIFNERVQSIIPFLQQLPSNYIGISSVAELVVCGMSEMGLSAAGRSYHWVVRMTTVTLNDPTTTGW